MKKILLLSFLIGAVTFGAAAQTESYKILKKKFNDSPEVHSFSVGGWVCKIVFSLAGEYEFKEAVEDIDHIRLLTIPKNEFAAKDVSVRGFKRLLKQDKYEQLAHIRDNGEDVTIYLRELSNKKNYYFVLVESESEVVAIEMKGYINPEVLKDKNLALNN